MAVNRTISDDERRSRLVMGHRLGSAASNGAADESDPVEVARSLVALHSSDPVSVYLSVLGRAPNATVGSVSDSLYEDRELVRVHGMRRTLWVAEVGTAADIVAASADRLVRIERRRLASFLTEAGVSDTERWIDEARSEIHAFIVDAGLVDTQTIGGALPHRAVGFEVAAGKKYSATISAHTRILLILGYGGHILRAAPKGTWIASQYRWADSVSWLGRPLNRGSDPSDREPDSAPVAAAQAAMVDRYLQAFGPATTEDVVWWTGWPKGVVTTALTSVGAVEVELEGGRGWLSASDTFDPTSVDGDAVDETVAVLPGLDPTTMGWKQRDHYLNPAMTTQLFDRNGNGGPTVWVGGRIAGGWAQRDDGELVYRLLTDVSNEAEHRVERELERLSAGIGETCYKVRFPSPLNTELRL